MYTYNMRFLFVFFLYVFGNCSITSQPIVLCKQHKSNYVIIIGNTANKTEQKAANILQQYFKKVTNIQLPIVKESNRNNQLAIYVGYTDKAKQTLPYKKIHDEGFILATQNEQAFIYAATDKGLLYAVYEWIERYLQCRKLDAEPSYCPSLSDIAIDNNIIDIQQPAFEYREVYYPYEKDEEYILWHKLHTIERDWGLWGHSFNKLIPAAKYFTTHPEYFSLINDKRKTTGLCLSNPSLKKEIISLLKERIQDNPDAIYWSISPEEGAEWCTCNACSILNQRGGGPQGSLFSFINDIAAAFPQQKIVTLAYEQTSEPVKNINIRNNVYVMLSDIEVYRHQPIATSSSAAVFRKRLSGWHSLTPNIFIWDYITQFTNYLAPFPNLQTLQPNLQFLQSQTKGIFEQGSGETASENISLRSYLLAKWLWNPSLNRDSLQQDFLQYYYGKASIAIQQYIEMLEDGLQKTKASLDIYGNPIDARKTFLSPENIDKYSIVLDKAEALTEGDDYTSKHVAEVRMPLEYTVLQQARYFGVDQYGLFEAVNNTYYIKPSIIKRLYRLVKQCEQFGINSLSEISFTPKEYAEEWKKIIDKGYKTNKALNASVSLKFNFNEEYYNKGPRTIVDGMYGFTDYSYNWLCFYGVDMEATIILPTANIIHQIELHFLDDPKHYIFLPGKINISYSNDGKNYIPIASKAIQQTEHYDPIITPYIFDFKNTSIKYIKIIAYNPMVLPNWRLHSTKKPMLACDEVYLK